MNSAGCGVGANHIRLEPAYILHRKAYRETSFLIELFTLNHGRIAVIARGVRKQNSKWSGLLQPFVPIMVSWSGRSDLKNLNQVELAGVIPYLAGPHLYCGFYLNELLMILLYQWAAQADIFELYQHTLIALAENQQLTASANSVSKNWQMERIMRLFEKRLIAALGYAPLNQDNAQTFLPMHYYDFIPEQGFVNVDVSCLPAKQLFLGKTLTAIAMEDFFENHVLTEAKRLLRLILKPLLGQRTLYSRQLFLQV